MVTSTYALVGHTNRYLIGDTWLLNSAWAASPSSNIHVPLFDPFIDSSRIVRLIFNTQHVPRRHANQSGLPKAVHPYLAVSCDADPLRSDYAVNFTQVPEDFTLHRYTRLVLTLPSSGPRYLRGISFVLFWSKTKSFLEPIEPSYIFWLMLVMT